MMATISIQGRRFLNLLVFVLCIALIFGGCGKKNSFLSKSALKKKVVGTWHLVPLLPSDKDEDWQFNDDNSFTATVVSTGAIKFSGTFSVAARLFNSQLRIADTGDYIYDGTWYIIDINSSRMQINTNFKDCGGADHCGTFQREFVK